MKDNSNERFRRTVFLVIAGALVLAVAFGVLEVVSRQRDRALRAQVQSKLAEITAAGQPITPADLERMFPDPPPEADASRLLQAAMSRAVEPGSISTLLRGDLWAAPWFTSGEPLNPEMKLAIRAVVEANRTALQALPGDWPNGTRMPNQFGRGFTNASPVSLTQVRNLMVALALSAILHAEEGDSRNAPREIADGFRVSRTLQHQLIFYMFCRTGENLSCRALERVLSHTALSEPELLGLMRTVTNAPANGMQSAMLAERCVGIWVDESMRSGMRQRWLGWRLSLLRQVSYRLERNVFSDSDLPAYLDFAGKFLALLKLPAAQRIRLAGELGQAQKKAVPSAALMIVAPDWQKALRGDAETEARLAAAQVALAIERHRLAHSGRLPDSLGDLAPTFIPAVPADPFDNQPLRYLKRPRGYVVYSVGPDGKDDHGLEKPGEIVGTTHYDVTFTVDR